ncbi:GT2 family glycosyltransferase [Humitalea rosea]|uniref:GT2 family glycosyltransferase n=1 Tax=Humitalea rosea TaxID=990373 RepID=A0A2W7IWK1_9PROT|nr:glycosyltransferase family 2 protein [Humitalea rosea]PZW51128.1 GT2 family glycosyltransferase [Humitalea rosea]
MPNAAGDRVTALVVTYNSVGVIAGCLDSLAGCGRIIVIDNASGDGTPALIATRCPRVEILANPCNQGFGRAHNRGYGSAATEFVLFMNPDARLRHGALAALVETADRHPDAALIAPRIENDGGDPVVSHDVELWRRSGLPRGGPALPEGEICAEFLSGAVLLLRRSALGAALPFDPAIFLFYEDDDLCLRLRRLGWSLVQTPAAIASHTGGGASAPCPRVTSVKSWHIAWSRLYFEAKHRGARSAWRFGRVQALRFAAKALAHGVTLNRAKALRDRARLRGTLAYLAGRGAAPPAEG